MLHKNARIALYTRPPRRGIFKSNDKQCKIFYNLICQFQILLHLCTEFNIKSKWN